MQSSQGSESSSQSIDRFIFVGGLLLLVVIVGTLLLAPQWSASTIDRLYVFITTRLGVLYVIAAILGVSIWRMLRRVREIHRDTPHMP